MAKLTSAPGHGQCGTMLVKYRGSTFTGPIASILAS
jgi:hypothetical protein